MRSSFLSILACTAVLAGCASSTDKADRAAATTESELRSSSVKYLGSIGAGEIKGVDYEAKPKYVGLSFSAQGGDTVTVDVTSKNGDAMVWITTSGYGSTLAENDDASSETLDSHVEYVVPKNKAATSYRIVVRDYDQLPSTFEISLSIKAAAPPPPPPPTCNPLQEPNRRYIGTPTQCMAIRYACEPGWQSFANACGCGCEH